MPFLQIFMVILPVFMLIAAGALYAKILKVPHDWIDGLMSFAQSVGVPCLLFRAMLDFDMAGGFDPLLLVAFYAAAVVCFAAGILISQRFLGLDKFESAGVGFAAMYSNALLLGVPITEMAFGKGASTVNFMIIAVQPPICYTVGVATIEAFKSNGRGMGKTVKAALWGTLRQPHVVALLLGLICNLAAISLPAFVEMPLEMLAGAALPVALFGLGGVLIRFRIHGSLRKVGVVLALSLIVSPAITLVLGLLFALPTTFLRSAVITSAMAPGVNSYLFARMYRTAEDTISSSIVIGTVISVFTVSLCILVLNAVG